MPSNTVYADSRIQIHSRWDPETALIRSRAMATPPDAATLGAAILQSSSGRALTREVVRGVLGMLKKGL